MSDVIKEGSEIEIVYEGKLGDGRVIDTNKGKDPLHFIVGSSSIIQGINEAVVGMKEGETKRVTIKPEKAYGFFDKGLIHKIKRNLLPKDVHEGCTLSDNNGVTWVVKNLQKNYAILDGNSPLADQILTYNIDIKKVLPSH